MFFFLEPSQTYTGLFDIIEERYYIISSNATALKVYSQILLKLTSSKNSSYLFTNCTSNQFICLNHVLFLLWKDQNIYVYPYTRVKFSLIVFYHRLLYLLIAFTIKFKALSLDFCPLLLSIFLNFRLLP